MAFAKLKALLGTAGERTVERLWDFLGVALDAFSPQECRNYFRHCGYPIQTLRRSQTGASVVFSLCGDEFRRRKRNGVRARTASFKAQRVDGGGA
jgi:hypothetical protein